MRNHMDVVAPPRIFHNHFRHAYPTGIIKAFTSCPHAYYLSYFPYLFWDYADFRAIIIAPA